MKLNAFGRAAMNNAARAALQRFYVAPVFERLARFDGPPGLVLEIGCGGGAGVILLRDRFAARRILAFDVDARMVARARRRLASHPGGSVTLAIADATHIPVADHSVDAVFDFGAIHLVEDWEGALDETRRVLRPGGVYCFEWVTGRVLRSLYPLVTEGFRRMVAPDAPSLLAALERRGILVGENHVRPSALAATNLVGDVIGVGRVRV